MAMHLAHPALTMNGKRRGPQKWASAEAKRRAEELDREWRAKTEEYKRMSKSVFKPTSKSAETLRPRIPPGRETPHIPSVDTGHKGAVSSKPAPVYTGDAVLGVTILHKSCLQPVFSKQEAIDASKMRR